MKADLTRNSFHPLKHFTRVVMQQGRVQLDADWNEQAAILLRYIQALAADLIGPHGGPRANLGFQIVGGVANNFAITPGHYYVDGILCELAPPFPPLPVISTTKTPTAFTVRSAASFKPEQLVLLSSDDQGALATVKSVNPDNNSVMVQGVDDVTTILGLTNLNAYPDPVTFLSQPDYVVPAGTTFKQGQTYLIYLDVWERLVTYVEDDTIREVALGGAETAARTKLVCQVKQMPGSKCDIPLKTLYQPDHRGLLKVVANQQSVSPDPCVIAPDASYRGPENQLYRVEIHTGNLENASAIPTFKWSRENGSVIFPIVKLTSGGGTTTTVVLENLGRDDRFGLKENDWVEIQDDEYVLQNRAEPLLQVQSIANGLTVTLSGTSTVDASKHPLLRRWDLSFGDPAEGALQQAADNAARIVEGSDDANWLSLENGIQIQFQPAPQGNTNQYRTGDYWLIPARTATGDVEWPTAGGGPLARPPDGVDHHYAPLSVISIDPGNNVKVEPVCQKVFDYLPPPAAPGK